MTTRRLRVAAALIAATVLASCSSGSPTAPRADLGRELAAKVDIDSIYTHLRKLGEIADANNHTRAEGTPGFDASVDYVAQTLRDNGFDVQTPEFERLGTTRGGNPTLTVSGRGYPVDQASLLLTTPPGGLSAKTLRPQKPAGCSAADYGTAAVTGAIAVVDDAGCSIVDKQRHRRRRGSCRTARGERTGRQRQPRGAVHPRLLPAAQGSGRGDRQRRQRRTASHRRAGSADAGRQGRHGQVTKHVGADKTGDTRNVVVVGAHLAAWPAAPASTTTLGCGRGAGSRGRVGSQPQTTNAVRFAFWGSEEVVEGSTNYVRELDRDQLNDIALYLNFDMLGSPTPVSSPTTAISPVSPTPTFRPATCPPDRRHRADPGRLPQPCRDTARRPAVGPQYRLRAFLAAGVPFGGATTGAAQRKPRCRPGCGAGGPVSPSTRTTHPGTPSTTSTGMRCRSWDPRSRSRSARTRSQQRAPTASRRATETDFPRERTT